MKSRLKKSYLQQRGFVLAYLLFAIALLAALATAYASMSRAKTQAERVAEGTDRITTAYNVVRSRIHACIAGENLPTLADYNAIEPALHPDLGVQVIEVLNMTCEDGGTLIDQGPLIRPPSGFRDWLFVFNNNDTDADASDDTGPAIVVVPETAGTELAILGRSQRYFEQNYSGLVLPPDFIVNAAADVDEALVLSIQ